LDEIDYCAKVAKAIRLAIEPQGKLDEMYATMD
jgi:hypothetical protein